VVKQLHKLALTHSASDPIDQSFVSLRFLLKGALNVRQFHFSKYTFLLGHIRLDNQPGLQRIELAKEYYFR
jgi:hypothetical protein